MFKRFPSSFRSVRAVALVAAAAGALSACGGGDDDAATAAEVALTCNTAGYVAGSVQTPTVAQLTAYVGSYDGEEGAFDGSGTFVKSGTAALVLGSGGSVTYKGTAYTPTSVCIEKAAGLYGTLLYVVAGKGHLDIADKADATLGSAWGVSPADGTTMFQKGAKR